MSHHDKVLNMVRETLLHENVLERFSFACRQRLLVLEFWQPDPQQAWPDRELTLTFSGVTSLHLAANAEQPDFAGEMTDFTCERSGEQYRARITTQQPPFPACHLELTFADLKFDRQAK